MAKIVVEGTDRNHRCVISEPDEDGDYTFSCAHGDKMVAWSPLADVINEAEIHADRGWGWSS